MWVFYSISLIVLGLGIISLRGGIRFLNYVRRETVRPLATFTPFVSVIAPCRGLDQGLKDNLTALFQQDYPAYETIFVTDSETDYSLRVIEEIRQSSTKANQISRPCSYCGRGD